MDLPATGQLTCRIRLLLQSDSPSVAFGLDTAYSAPLPMWAKHEPVGAAIYFGTAQIGDGVTDRFIVRRMAGTEPEQVTVSHVVEFDGQRYRVKRASDLGGARRFTLIEAEHLGAIA